MANTYWDSMGYSRLFNTSWVDQTGDNGNVSNWTIGDNLIFVVQVYSNTDACNKDNDGLYMKLLYSPDAGNNWYDVDTGGKIVPGSGTLTDDQTSSSSAKIPTSLAICASGFQSTNGVHENAGDNTLPDSGVLSEATTEVWHELWWELDTSNADPGATYHFAVYDLTNTSQFSPTTGIGISANVTMASAGGGAAVPMMFNLLHR